MSVLRTLVEQRWIDDLMPGWAVTTLAMVTAVVLDLSSITTILAATG